MMIYNTRINLTGGDLKSQFGYNSNQLNQVTPAKLGEGKNILAGDLNLQDNKILQKRKEAWDNAMKVVEDAFAGERSIDQNMEERHKNIESLKADIQNVQKELDQIENEKNDLIETHNITEDCQEQKDLELLQKREKRLKGDATISFNEEEKARLKEIDETGMTEYQIRSLELDEQVSEFQKTMENNQKLIELENKTIEAIKLEKLKSHPMVDAANAAEDIMDAANEEIIGMLVEEAKESTDQKLEEDKQKAEKLAKEKKEQEEKLETDKKYQEGTVEETTEIVLELNRVKNDVQKEVRDILNKMTLLEEDIKGVVADVEV